MTDRWRPIRGLALLVYRWIDINVQPLKDQFGAVTGEYNDADTVMHGFIWQPQGDDCP